MTRRGTYGSAARGTLLALSLLLAVGGCGKDLVVGGARDTEAVATDSRDTQPAGTVPGVRGNALAATAATGTLTFAARVVLVAADGATEPLGAAPATATVGIGARDTARLAARALPARRYATARVVFTAVEANVATGLVVGGISLAGRVSVAIPDSVVVERAVTLPPGDGPVRLVVDLRSSEWLGAVDPATRVVPAAAFRGAVRVSAVARP